MKKILRRRNFCRTKFRETFFMSLEKIHGKKSSEDFYGVSGKKSMGTNAVYINGFV